MGPCGKKTLVTPCMPTVRDVGLAESLGLLGGCWAKKPAEVVFGLALGLKKGKGPWAQQQK